MGSSTVGSTSFCPECYETEFLFVFLTLLKAKTRKHYGNWKRDI